MVIKTIAEDALRNQMRAVFKSIKKSAWLQVLDIRRANIVKNIGANGQKRNIATMKNIVNK